MRAWLSLLFALLLIPVAIAVTAFLTRTASIACTRAGEQITCHETESIGPFQAFSATVENVKIARDMTDPEGGSSGVFIETQSGDNLRFTSSFLDSGQQSTIADRIHQFIFVHQDQPELAFTLPVSLLNLGLGAGFVLAMLIWAAFSAVRIARPPRR
jgi:hypothetical protein